MSLLSPDEAPEILYEQTGLQIRRNRKNSFVVVRLHHTADPHKRGDKWRAEAASGLTQARFEQEYDINYSALQGELVFPQLKSKADKIILRDPLPTFPESQQFYAGMDYGVRNPSAFVVFAEFDGILYAVWELYEPAPDINLFANKMRSCPYWERIKFVVCDPHMMDRTTHAEGVATTVAFHFRNAGIRNLVRGDSTEPGATAWVAGLHEHWSGEEPTFKIFHNCRNLIQELEGALYMNQSDLVLVTSNYKERMVDKRNHAMDATKYYMLFKPKTKPPRKVKIPVMWKWFS